MPGLMVAEIVIDRIYVPFAAAGLTVRRWLRNVLMLSASCSSVKLSFPTGAATFPPLSLRNSILPALNSRTPERDVRRDGPRPRRGHQPAGAEQPAERPDDAHHVGRGQGDVEIHEPALDPLGQVVAANDVRARGGRLLGVVPLGEHRDADRLADPVREGDRAPDVLVALTGSIPRFVETSTDWMNFVVPNVFNCLIASASGIGSIDLTFSLRAR